MPDRMESKSLKELVIFCKEKGIKGYSGKKKAELIALLTAPQAPANVIITVPTHKNKSPLRYPGGKTRAIAILENYVKTYFPTKTVLLSPFFGGGSFELAMKCKCKIYANDLFVPLYNFWKVVQSQSAALVAAIRAKMPVTKESFHNMRSTILENKDPLDQAAAYFCINRSSFSGATLCGGFSAQAAAGRLTESSLQTLAACDTKDIEFSNLDCIAFLEAHPQTNETLVYADPPYYISSYIYGKDGDMHTSFNHEAFAAAIQKRTDWIISYNDCEYIRNLYKDCWIVQESWSYGMNTSKKSSEIIILPSCMRPRADEGPLAHSGFWARTGLLTHAIEK
jgi:DNA adenine methylase